jgi:hypothetical protein
MRRLAGKGSTTALLSQVGEHDEHCEQPHGNQTIRLLSRIASSRHSLKQCGLTSDSYVGMGLCTIQIRLDLLSVRALDSCSPTLGGLRH